MIGDGQYDVQAGHAAGMRTIWLSHGQPRDFAAIGQRLPRRVIFLGGYLCVPLVLLVLAATLYPVGRRRRTGVGSPEG